MSTTHRSLIYGLKVAAPFALPGPSYEGLPEVSITEQTCPEWLENALQVSTHLQVNSNACLTRIPTMGSVLIQRDGRITLDCPPGIPNEWKLTLALGSGLGTYLHLIGRIPLHGMAWIVNGNATLVLGRSGTGKSTLAAAMLRCGHQLLSDDVIPVSHTPGESAVAYPAHPRFKLSPALLDALDVDIKPLPKVLPSSEKLAWTIPSSAFHSRPAPISRCIILLPTRSSAAQITLQALTGVNALQRLKRQVYRPQLVSAFGHQNQLFALAHQLATQSTIEVCQLPDLNSFSSFDQYTRALDERFALQRQ